jgi:hemerythrin-like domain-containing protein
MRFEEEQLLPVYARAGRVPGGPEELFTGEHRKLLEFLGRIRELLRIAAAEPTGSARNRAVLAVFDEETSFKNLLHHHDARERNILYPMLDKVATDSEKTELLRRAAAVSID